MSGENLALHSTLWNIINNNKEEEDKTEQNTIKYITLFLCLIINGRTSRIGEPPPSYKWREQMQSSRGLGEGYHMRRPPHCCEGQCVAVLDSPATNLALVKPSSIGYCDLEFKVKSQLSDQCPRPQQWHHWVLIAAVCLCTFIIQSFHSLFSIFKVWK